MFVSSFFFPDVVGREAFEREAFRGQQTALSSGAAVVVADTIVGVAGS